MITRKTKMPVVIALLAGDWPMRSQISPRMLAAVMISATTAQNDADLVMGPKTKKRIEGRVSLPIIELDSGSAAEDNTL